MKSPNQFKKKKKQRSTKDGEQWHSPESAILPASIGESTTITCVGFQTTQVSTEDDYEVGA